MLILAVLGWLGWQAWGAQQFRAAEQSLARRDFAQAEQHLRHCLRVWPNDAQTLLLAAQTARRAGARADALARLHAAERAGAVHEAVILERDLLQMQGGDLSQVQRYLEIAQRHPDNPAASLILEAAIVGSLQAMDLARARTVLDIWETKHRTTADQTSLWSWRGELEVRAGRVDAAANCFRAAIQLDPANRGARLGLVRILAHSSPDEAVEHLSVLLEADPADSDARSQYAVALRNLGHLEDATVATEQLLSRAPEHVEGLVLRGRIAMDQQQFDEAGQWLRRAESLEPQRYAVLLALGDYCRLTGQDDDRRRYEQQLAALTRRIEAKFKGATPPVESSDNSPGQAPHNQPQ
jgi:tetratricopeptide (TPR) repeat protein